MSDDERFVRAVIDEWLTATARGDIDAVLALMTDDVEFVTANAPPFGKKAFEASGRAMAVESFVGRPAIREVVISGRYAFVRNDLSIEMTMKGGAPMRLEGPILSVFKKGDDEKWRLWRDANFVAPAK